MLEFVLRRTNSNIMKSTQYTPEKLANFLKEHKIATMEELKRALGTKVDVTVFRKLRKLSYRTSYSHRGSRYTLDSIPEFDEMGLWSYRSVRFSRHGNLILTVQALVEDADAGLVASELDKLLQVRAKDSLLKLVRTGRLARRQIGGQFVYLCADLPRQKQQIWARGVRQERLNSLGSPALDSSNDELKAALILFLATLDEKQVRLYAGLESLKWGHGGDSKLAAILGLDVGTIARGRRELLGEDIEVDRVRRAGAGRKPVGKKHQR